MEGEDVSLAIGLAVILCPILGFLAYFAFQLGRFGWWLAELAGSYLVAAAFQIFGKLIGA